MMSKETALVKLGFVISSLSMGRYGQRLSVSHIVWLSKWKSCSEHLVRFLVDCVAGVGNKEERFRLLASDDFDHIQWKE